MPAPDNLKAISLRIATLCSFPHLKDAVDDVSSDSRTSTEDGRVTQLLAKLLAILAHLAVALLHSVSNGTAKDFILPDSDLDKLLKEVIPLKPIPRADYLYNSVELEKAHMAAAVTGDSAAPSSQEPIGYHFISFTKGQDGHLYDLEGSWGGPVDRGTLADDEDLLSDKALEATVKKFTKVADGNLEFSIIALATVPDEE
ncbi:hypothetical protein NM208_g3569 [Fusarium decemcellulare]|uniref:Uncharacterized protein n=1 Tax=Fusarium decemcellulare TaxID=57161 RepID=A0ACC1SNL2_9HYPO|nr:hypothetical protein NM208_g3569 [Fusarium decemcellulare]